MVSFTLARTSDATASTCGTLALRPYSRVSTNATAETKPERDCQARSSGMLARKAGQACTSRRPLLLVAELLSITTEH